MKKDFVRNVVLNKKYLNKFFNLFKIDSVYRNELMDDIINMLRLMKQSK